ncbi:MAG: protein-L-isoaspartate(D-aspartate) O-methyltransferase [Bacteroidetes bacterium]|jgi:protein-L-isoaspartate(D-aspartate) O-methyltransferase|nr:protein-L-isoaspartate(D-aspartate) O-methyltransferase [Bacteroidota bacterium]MBK6818918.1 protein-L-isoaspartate(D-aspartate) O-methyltransferase [Bacteroidota bacterium]MBK7041800.1 protein-L-isoaspartate(D-aspartate) O-methyltransferase [Bacteroidota bacterium]MBK7589332.1 protein-L-isoaspartate(D-aspartate) O-methyltransferase [Bacteroidota bacterium]MBK8328028.1 protein-L-isoaspartate(D-aspartate) O-methyltransferase [Bacteroidota bacterium]
MIQNKIDTYKHKGLRKKLIETIKNKGIKDEAVLQAIDKIPRHFFLDLAFDKIAYEDRAFPIGEGQTISQPYTVAYQTELLNIQPREKVLEIGTGSVYQATVLAEMGAQVFTIERQKKLYEKNMISYPFLAKYKNIKFFYGDGYKGLPTYAPFDKIIITAAAPMVPIDLIAQLKPLGVMVLPLGNEEHQTMTRLTKQVDGTLIEEKFENFVFVPMLKGKSDH